MLKKDVMREWQNCLSKVFIVAGKEMYKWLRYILRRWFRLSRPANPRIANKQLYKETSMGLVYRVFIPTPIDSDVVSRVLEYTFDGNSNTLDVNTVSAFVDLPPAKDNTNISVRLKDVDDAGNESDWSAPLVFTAKDTIVPRAPSGLATKLVAEVPDAPAPAPKPEPVPEPEPDVTPVVEVVEKPAMFSFKKST